MDKQVFKLTDSSQTRAVIIEAILNAPVGHVVIIQPETRTLAQNSMFHGICGQVAEQVPFNDRWLQLPQWKVLFISGHAIATGYGADMVQGIEKELVNLRESSAQMGVKRMNSVIDYTLAYCAENDVRLKADKRYEEFA